MNSPLPPGSPLPPLSGNRSFWGMTVAQFLGAFNDNLYKQLILLWCLQVAAGKADTYQPIAMLVFSIPFVLLSGYAGYLADKFSKQRIVLLCKVAEVLIMLLGMAAFATSHLGFMLIILFLMGVHSAFFGPSKYGILPEIVRDTDLPSANGIFQLTTFMAIIFGMIFAGVVKKFFGETLWMAGIPCVGFAVLGTISAHAVQATPRLQPGLKPRFSDFLIPGEIIQLLRAKPDLVRVLLLYSLFWFMGGVVQPSVNAVCKMQLHQDDAATSLAAGFLAIGIAVGCALSGILARGKIRFSLVRVGAWGMTLCLFLLAVPANSAFGGAIERDATGTLLGYQWTRIVLLLLGTFSGLFAVPLQVYLQVKSPAGDKGRLMGTMNLTTWIGIFFSAGFYGVVEYVLAWLHWPRNLIYGSLVAIFLPVALLGIRGRDEASRLEGEIEAS
jgi:acyl-[acyl-carrier-protein]-phospholipid O-acyltransferase/long-chain-fatty-acid--[acyl-carrier-protein] ligase